VTEINEKDGECKKKKEDPALSKEYRRFIYEQALNDADESENEEELLTMEGISPNSFFPPSSLHQHRRANQPHYVQLLSAFWAAFFGNQSVWIHCSPVRSLL
jgi:hypothetical protein